MGETGCHATAEGAEKPRKEELTKAHVSATKEEYEEARTGATLTGPEDTLIGARHGTLKLVGNGMDS